MNKYSKKIKYQEDKLYNKILLLSRNKLLYTKLNLKDSFQNRINLIFLHISFLFIKIKHNNVNSHYKEFYQKMFDIVFKKIELNMREVGHGDVTVNKNMKFLVKIFYIHRFSLYFDRFPSILFAFPLFFKCVICNADKSL